MSDCRVCKDYSVGGLDGICQSCKAEGWLPHDGGKYHGGKDVVDVIGVTGVLYKGRRSYGDWLGIIAYREVEPVMEVRGGVDDPIQPNHYKGTSMELIEAFEGLLERREYIGGLKMNIIKYVYRSEKKGGVQDLRKAKWYLERLISYMESDND